MASRKLGMAALALGLANLLASRSASAVTQPSGVVVPVLDPTVLTCADRNVQMCLNESEGGPGIIDAHTDALIAPETFQPTCNLTFKPIVKGGYNNAGFGWYNVKPDPANPGKFLKPLQTELHGMLFLNTHQQTGAQLAGQSASLDLAAERAAGRYAGGQIGFFLASGPYTFDADTRALTGTINELFFTQHELNPGSGAAEPYVQVLTWQSIKHPQSFYFGWEDQTASLASDNDFDDLVFLVGGIQCSGSGDACDTGALGVCAAGIKQCQKGQVVCVPSAKSSAEQCNALDDDCDGMVDDGDDLCPQGKVCDRGRCVPKCSTGEFRCAADTVCSTRGVCVEKACAEKICPAGQVCNGGECVDGCSGVVCPFGEVCRAGGCVNPCRGVMCDDGYACVLGACQSCECTACAAGKVCSQNVCVDTGCDALSCAAGQHCVMGGCVDDCQGSACPSGQLCMTGECVADPNAPGSGGGSGGSDPGSVPLGPLMSGGSGSGAGNVAGGGGASTPPQASSPGTTATGGEAAAKGCGCAVPRRGDSGSTAPMSLLALLGFLGLRRRNGRCVGRTDHDRREQEPATRTNRRGR